MTAPARTRAGLIRWIALAAGLCALWAVATVARMLVGGRSDIDVFTANLAWMICAPIAAAAVFAFAWWNRFRGVPTLAPWLVGIVGALTFYLLSSESAALLDANGYVTHVAFMVLVVVSASGWMITLASAQLAAAASATIVLGDHAGRRVVTFIWVALVVVVVCGLLVPPSFAVEQLSETPTILPRAFVLDPTVQAVANAISLMWMLSLLVAPIAFGVRAARRRGPERPALARIALGTVLPFVVVLLCGVMALTVAAGSDASVELVGLVVGFCAALPLTAWWLTAVVRDATSGDGRAVTALARIAPGVLWALYGLVLVQLAVPATAALGLGTAQSVVVTALAVAATAVPWLHFVRWCVRRVDPRRAVAAAIIGAAEADAPAGELAQTALQQALGEPNARLLIARPDGRWWDASQSEVVIPDPALLATPILDRDDASVGLLLSEHRFIDTRQLVGVARPLVERASLEASVRHHTDLLEAERRRADAAAAEARERIERDLHDGVQGRLVSLGLNLSLARETVPDPTSRLLIDETVHGLRQAVVELRHLATGTLSATLTDRGLAAALGDLVRQVPCEVDLTVDDVRMDGLTESVAYFVVAEAVANALKHADARRLSVAVRATGSSVSVTVADDGSGGADPRLGSGLRGLSERVRAAGGHLVVSERMPHGTLLEAVLPCER